MTEQEIADFKQKAMALQSLQTSLALQEKNLFLLEEAQKGVRDLYVKAEVAVCGTNQPIYLDQKMMQQAHTDLKDMVSAEIADLKRRIAFL